MHGAGRVVPAGPSATSADNEKFTVKVDTRRGWPGIGKILVDAPATTARTMRRPSSRKGGLTVTLQTHRLRGGKGWRPIKGWRSEGDALDASGVEARGDHLSGQPAAAFPVAGCARSRRRSAGRPPRPPGSRSATSARRNVIPLKKGSGVISPQRRHHDRLQHAQARCPSLRGPVSRPRRSQPASPAPDLPDLRGRSGDRPDVPRSGRVSAPAGPPAAPRSSTSSGTRSGWTTSATARQMMYPAPTRHNGGLREGRPQGAGQGRRRRAAASPASSSAAPSPSRLGVRVTVRSTRWLRCELRASTAPRWLRCELASPKTTAVVEVRATASLETTPCG